MTQHYEAVVIGSGFGGAICACRLSKQWPGQVLLLERGKRYPMGSFPRSPRDMARNFWNIADEGRARPQVAKRQESHGLFDIRNYRRMDVIMSAGFGGGSLIYANVFLEAPDNVFDQRWPESCKKNRLLPYYAVAKQVLGSRPVPRTDDPRRRILRTELFEKYAQEVGRSSELVDINVFFGNDYDNPLPIGHQDKNRYGALQTSCMYCAECDIGCNYHSKNTLDLNYLHVAETSYQTRALTEHLAQNIVPVDASGKDDPSADGSHGYHVYYRDLNGGSESHAVFTKRVVVSAGTLNSNELLLRCRDVYKSLPHVSQKLGHGFSGNGDFLSFVIGTNDPADPNYGPVITQRTDFNLFRDWDPERAFILEDASYPAFGAWFAEAAKPGVFRLKSLYRTVRHWIHRFVQGHSMGSMGFALEDLLSGDLSYNTGVLLCMGIDRSDGKMQLDRAGRVEMDWPQQTSMELYKAIIDAGRKFQEVFHAKKFVPNPTWWWPLRKNVTVHPLGGCALADSSEQGVTNASRDQFGCVFGYRNLYVADGSIVPTAVGANPTATISALSEMVAEGITGNGMPTADL